MNKANVFLLVVVSSLLTYISTATQPAATSGVAQEKWEYGVSVYRESKTSSIPTATLPQFSFISSNVHDVINPFNFLPTLEGEFFDFWRVNSSTGLSERVRIPLTEKYLLSSEIRARWVSLGDQGWHPYQVDSSEETYTGSTGRLNPNNELYMQTTYWRRRVQ